jgi:predicted nucleic-acid-binding Zn-ribbon protein
MRNTKACPKCGSRDIAVVPGVLNALTVSLGVLSTVELKRYMCVACGFCEEWIDSDEDREKVRKRFVPDSSP